MKVIFVVMKTTWAVVKINSALERFKLYVEMPSDPKFYLANTLSGLKKELLIGFTSLKRELSEEKRLRSTASSMTEI